MTESRHNLRLNAHPGGRFRPAGRLGGSSQLTGGRRLLLFPALFNKKMHAKMKVYPDKYCRISKHLARNRCRTVQAAILNRKAYSNMKVYPGMCFRISKTSSRPHGRTVRAALTVLTCRPRTGFFALTLCGSGT
jgi:hypothetical protein